MRRIVHYHPQIEEQLSEIILWYDDQQAGLGDFFLEKFDDTVKYISGFPEGIEIKRKKFRVAKLDNFPYVIVFELHKIIIEIYSVTHTSRHPGKKFRRNKSL
jgi:hypothetical protein